MQLGGNLFIRITPWGHQRLLRGTEPAVFCHRMLIILLIVKDGRPSRRSTKLVGQRLFHYGVSGLVFPPVSAKVTLVCQPDTTALIFAMMCEILLENSDALLLRAVHMGKSGCLKCVLLSLCLQV